MGSQDETEFNNELHRPMNDHVKEQVQVNNHGSA